MTGAVLPQAISEIDGYHAHIYYDSAATRERAAQIRQQIADRFVVQLGGWHDGPVGPHARAMYQIAFTNELFPTLVPWLMLNRQGLSVLVHPNTDNPHDDHLIHALWLGDRLAVDAGRLPRSMRAEGREHGAVVPNTRPLA